uniref:hypothetical protein n=1 Tax=Gelidibacter sp. TaxID=2018083 RepID=UPI0040492C76
MAYAQTYYPKSKTILYLNNLAAKAFQKIYKTKREDTNRFVHFFKTEVPMLMYQYKRYVLYAFLIFGSFVAIGALSAAHDDTFVRLILGDHYVNMSIENIEKGDMNMLTGVIALVSIIISKKSQRLGDIAAGTSVITLKNNVNISHTILEDIETTYVPTYPSVIRLSDNDARIIKETFLTAKATRDYQTLIKLRKKIVEVIDVKQEDGNDMQFIDTILKDYNYYTQSM